jgi:hypothetical protein
VVGTSPPFSTIQAFPSVLGLPYTIQWNLSLQQSIGNVQTITLAYVGASGHKLLRTEEYVGGVAGVPQTFTQLLFTNNAGYSNDNSLQLQFQRRVLKGAHIIASYSLSHSLDDVSTDTIFNGIPARFLTPRMDYGPSDFDIRHTATVGADCSPHFRYPSPFSRAILSNWSIDPIAVIRSAPPVDVVVSRDIGFGTYDFRPDTVPGVRRYLNDATTPGGHRFNPMALSIPTTPRQGSLGRNTFRGFSLFEADVAISRRFRVVERYGIQARFEAFNLFNHPNFSPPVGRIGSVDSQGNFSPQNGFGTSQTILSEGLQGGSLGAGFSPLYQIGGARSLEFAVKIDF